MGQGEAASMPAPLLIIPLSDEWMIVFLFKRIVRFVRGPGASPGEFTDAITLPKNNDAHKLITAAEELLKEEAWGDVARALQSLLDAKEDAFVQLRRKVAGKETVQWLSIRAEANRLIGTM